MALQRARGKGFLTTLIKTPANRDCKRRKGFGVQGTILILDGVATNRIMLKVQLSAAYYHVVQADRLAGIADIVARTRPDLILMASVLPDGGLDDLFRMRRNNEELAAIPLVVVTPQNDRAARLGALSAGADDALSQPMDDMLLQARIRRLIRARNQAEELGPGDSVARVQGMAEPATEFVGPASVALLTAQRATGAIWRARLKPHFPHPLHCLGTADMHRMITDGLIPDAIVIGVSRAPGDPDLRLIADLRARNTTRHAAIIAVNEGNDRSIAAEALDLGADDVLQDGFHAQELALRLSLHLRRKRRSDRLRDRLRDGLRAAVRDPMTGLYNRRHALPHLARVAHQAAGSGRGFAVMLADLDHFKTINDRYGHPAGDAVLTETARRLRAEMRPGDMLARVGGEEFLIVLEDTDRPGATRMAELLCRRIDTTPFRVEGCGAPIHVTLSIGVVVGPAPAAPDDCTRDSDCDGVTRYLIGQADRALYESKGAGRNKVTLIGAAA